jgi:uncharacterized protein YecT (DUF1311 family)
MSDRIASLTVLLVGGTAQIARAQDNKPTARQIAAIRGCAEKNQDDVTNVGMADCFRLETSIWDALLNDNFKHMRASLDDAQAAKAREMQCAWIAYRDSTCRFYDVKIQGTMAIPMGAACVARETARRALLLKFLDGL